MRENREKGETGMFFADSVVCSAVEMGQRCAVFTNIHYVQNLGKKRVNFMVSQKKGDTPRYRLGYWSND